MKKKILKKHGNKQPEIFVSLDSPQLVTQYNTKKKTVPGLDVFFLNFKETSPKLPMRDTAFFCDISNTIKNISKHTQNNI